MAAKNGPGNWMNSLMPAVAWAPMRNKGVASPPLNPSPRLRLVVINFWIAKLPDSKWSANGRSKNSDPKPMLS